jgi:putative ABC transport system substrate-binding protein
MQIDLLRRREFIRLLGSAAAWPLAARGQQADRMKRLAVLTGLDEHDPESKARLVGFWRAFETLGWLEGRNVLVDYRYAPAGTAAQARAKELVALHPDVILAAGTPNTAALKQETSTIPVVFVGVADPISSGFAESLVRPGGNFTGFMLYEESITGKWLAMLKEIAPAIRRAAIVSNPKTVPYDYFLRAAEAAAPLVGLQIMPERVENTADIERTIKSLAQVPGSGMILPPDTTTLVNRDLVIRLAALHRLPAVYSLRNFVTGGGLMSYGTDFVNLFRQAAVYVDRVLSGAKPADLPVQVPTRYETIINVKTANALGLAVPPALLVAADEVIE